jgi:hypothetical protein
MFTHKSLELQSREAMFRGLETEREAPRQAEKGRSGLVYIIFTLLLMAAIAKGELQASWAY